MRSRPPARAPAKRDEAKRRASTASSTMRASSRRPGKAISCRAPTKRAGEPKLSPPKRTSQRQKVLMPILTDFFRWIQACHAQVKDVRSLLTTATGYAIRHEAALLRFLEDGRLKITNNHSERALRTIAVGRKNWLFCG